MSLPRLALKTVLLFLVFEIVLMNIPLPLGTASLYRLLHVERQRLPISTLPSVDAALDVGNIDAMLASHAVSLPKAANEFRVLVLGDSAVWGLQLTPGQTLPGQLDQLGLTCGSKRVRVYDLSYPRSSATKDLMILDKASGTQPDLVVWLITWYTLMPKTRVDHWLVTENPAEFYKLGRRFDFLPKDYQPANIFEQWLNRNRTLFRVLRYQLYAFIQIATAQDQIPGPPEVLPSTLSSDTTFEGLRPPTLRANQVSIDQIKDIYELAGKTPVILVNEPMLIMTGVANSDVRYNSYYPRWVYDQYRRYVQDAAQANAWRYLDLWDAFPAQYFTDTPLHLNPLGQRMLAEMLAPAITANCP